VSGLKLFFGNLTTICTYFLNFSALELQNVSPKIKDFTAFANSPLPLSQKVLVHKWPAGVLIWQTSLIVEKGLGLLWSLLLRPANRCAKI